MRAKTVSSFFVCLQFPSLWWSWLSQHKAWHWIFTQASFAVVEWGILWMPTELAKLDEGEETTLSRNCEWFVHDEFAVTAGPLWTHVKRAYRTSPWVLGDTHLCSRDNLILLRTGHSVICREKHSWGRQWREHSWIITMVLLTDRCRNPNCALNRKSNSCYESCWLYYFFAIHWFLLYCWLFVSQRLVNVQGCSWELWELTAQQLGCCNLSKFYLNSQAILAPDAASPLRRCNDWKELQFLKNSDRTMDYG